MVLLLLFITGSSFGSFLNVAIDRLPKGGSLLRPPSHCFSCGVRLRAFDLIPIISYMWLHGRCRTCHAAIPRRSFEVEWAGGLSFAAAYLLYLKLGAGEELFFIMLSVGILSAMSVMVSARRTPVLVMAGATLVAIAMAPFWSPAGALRPFPFESGLLGSELDADAAALIAITVFLAYSMVFHVERRPDRVMLVGLAGMMAGLPGIMVAVPAALSLRGGMWGVGQVRHAHYSAPFAVLLAVCAITALLVEPWSDAYFG